VNHRRELLTTSFARVGRRVGPHVRRNALATPLLSLEQNSCSLSPHLSRARVPRVSRIFAIRTRFLAFVEDESEARYADSGLENFISCVSAALRRFRSSRHALRAGNANARSAARNAIPLRDVRLILQEFRRFSHHHLTKRSENTRRA